MAASIAASIAAVRPVLVVAFKAALVAASMIASSSSSTSGSMMGFADLAVLAGFAGLAGLVVFAGGCGVRFVLVAAFLTTGGVRAMGEGLVVSISIPKMALRSSSARAADDGVGEEVAAC